ncbi:MAG TPA: MFS transporter [Acidisoma sp.]|uniref:MFS transporter n=1 Tax=Acidisoma sp. TaxID=1872115 RepID=UPI002CFC2648|nr:MFS transporter [Acidisoma sp.]HTI03315.1 MFS transporter [Acidisoma sp.]
MSPSAHLALINFFTGDIQGGLGPFLATWLAASGHWSPARTGAVMTAIGVFALLLNGPAGAIVDHARHPRALLAAACGAILLGTLMIVPAAHDLVWILLSQCLAAAGGILLLPALTLFTLGIVGKAHFPGQQGRNQAFNHAGIVFAAILIGLGSHWLGAATPFWIFGAMAFGAILSVLWTPLHAFNGRRAHGWEENEPDEVEHRSGMGSILRNGRLALLAVALGLFNLANGYMLALVAQRLVAAGRDGGSWLAGYVIVAQLTMIPVALWAGSVAERSGRRRLLMVACLVLPVRAFFSAFVTDPFWLILGEVLDGVSSGLIGVAVPLVVADLTWGSGRTQTALGAVNTGQGVGGALSGLAGGAVVTWFGWQGAFLALAVPAAAAAALVFWLEESREVKTMPAGLEAGEEAGG